MDGCEKLLLERFVVESERRFEWADQIADHIFRRIVHQRRKTVVAAEARREGPGDGLDEQAMLGHRKGMVADGLSVPAGYAREPMGDVADLDIEGRRVEQIEPAATQHALPSTRSGCGRKSHHRP